MFILLLTHLALLTKKEENSPPQRITKNGTAEWKN
jgi:hypothetical protein